ncbi:MAG: helix-turn-helix transcriptional regulator [Gemmatimonadetes bacterium]|nr:helix-turn-helix transcriptional regulator [Gemmatimonadota bacterium]
METPLSPLNPRDYLILLSLSERPRHGYGLLKDIARLTENEVHFDPANLYRSLKRMIKQELVTEMSPPPDAKEGDTRRRYYGITNSGARTVQAEAARLARLTKVAQERNLVPDSEAPA